MTSCYRQLKPRLLAACTVLVAALLLPHSGDATTLRPLDLAQLAARAELVFHGRVSTQETRFDEFSQRVVTVTHFEVIDALKGDPAGTHSIKQLGGQLPGSETVHRVHGIPRFINGASYIVFLPPASRLGFSSPVGLVQGTFEVSLRAGGKVVSNGRRHDTLLSATAAGGKPALSATLKPAGDSPRHIEIDSFKQVVRQLVQP